MRAIHSISGKLPVMVIIILAVVMCLGVGAVTFVKMNKKPGGSKAVQHVELIPWKLEEFVVNLADKDECHYMKICIVLEVEKTGKGGGGGGEGGSDNPEEAKARDAIITVITRKHYNDLLEDDGKEKFKAEMKSALNSILEETKVDTVYFTSFAMQ